MLDRPYFLCLFYNLFVELKFSKSWRKTITSLLIVILLCSIVSSVITISIYQRKIRNTYIDENKITCDKWISSVDSRLNNIHEQIHEIFVYLYNNSDFSKDVENIDPFIANKIVNLMGNKLITTTDISALFLLDEANDHYIYDCSSRISTKQNYILKENLKVLCKDNPSYLSNRSWDIKTIGDNNYFYKAIKLGRYTIGAISDCSLYSVSDSLSVSGEKVSCFFSNNESNFLSYGDENLGKYINANVEESRYSKGYLIATCIALNAQISGTLVVTPSTIINVSVYLNIILLLFSFFIVVLIILLYGYMKKIIAEPTSKLIVANNQVSSGNLDYRLNPSLAGSEEFEELYKSFNDMSDKIGKLTIESYDTKLKEEKNRLIMLRAQIRPHTFLNGITTISNMTYNSDPEIIREYISSFAQFTRYMLHTNSEWTSIKDELENINNYVEMQKIRFPNSIEFSYDCIDDIKAINIPFLLLFSLVENCFKHAMSLYNTLHIYIKGEHYEKNNFKGIRLMVEDDGSGFPEEVLMQINMENNVLYTKEHMGLTNIRYTLHIIYNRDDLLVLSNKQEGGARVELLIPESVERNEIIDM